MRLLCCLRDVLGGCFEVGRIRSRYPDHPRFVEKIRQVDMGPLEAHKLNRYCPNEPQRRRGIPQNAENLKWLKDTFEHS